ncbi:lipopolysaccharide assembly protein LapB [Paenibacillus sp. IHB B 3415]|uniref:tetratricopeptide repeat protein n=1 Tax=Paenibacillus sp. IHB B 3415 TaxID=867080 RepID=UPI001364B1FE|nr:tetratricopeptide repeat protein [Paenibacillus sp. IHB B 3415]
MDSLYDQGEEAYASGDFVRALALFTEEWELGHSGDCLNYMGCCHLSLGEYPAALSCFERLRQKSPEWERPLFNLGRVYFRLGKLGKAFRYYETALRMNPASEDALYYMGTYYYEVEDYAQAQRCYEQSLKLNEAQSETHLNLGMCYVRMSDSKSALKEFERAYELDLSCYDAMRNKGLVLLGMREFKEALDAFGLAAKIQPDETECMTGIIYCHAKLKDYETALWIARKLLELEPGSDQALRFIEKLEVSVARQIHGER